MAAIGTNFYVEIPRDRYWNTGKGDIVIEARPYVVNDGKYAFEKTDQYVREHLVVVNPKDYGWNHVSKSAFVQCDGPVRRLSPSEYVTLYHSINPKHPLPSDYKIVDGKAVYQEDLP